MYCNICTREFLVYICIFMFTSVGLHDWQTYWRGVVCYWHCRGGVALSFGVLVCHYGVFLCCVVLNEVLAVCHCIFVMGVAW
jgi:hypothetical protein